MYALVQGLEPAARITVATLFNSLWEAAILAFAVWAVLRVFPNINATTRYAAWCTALVGSLLLPLATAIPQIDVQAMSSASPAPAARRRVSTAIAAPAPAPQTQAQANRAVLIKFPERFQVAVPEYVALAIFGAWVLATLTLLLRLAINLWRLEQLKRDALPLPVDYRERLAQWSAAEKGQRDVRLCVCNHIDVPVAVGLFDSMILIPQHLLDTLSASELDQIMLHELGHLRRGDDWTNGLQRVIQALFFFNPALLYIAQQLDLEREVACDDWVVHQTKSVRPYATCLTKMAEVTAWPHRPLAAPGVFVTRRGLSVRVERLLRAGRNIRTSISFGPAGAVAAALLVLFFILQNVAPTFAFTASAPEPASTPRPLAEKAASSKERIVYRDRTVVRTVAAAVTPKPSASPGEIDVTIPAQHIHMPARTIHVPAVNVDIPRRHIHMAAYPSLPPMPVWSFPPGLRKDISRQVHDAVGGGSSKNFNCVGCDFTGQNLSGRNFRGQKLSGTDFTRANLQNADFSYATIVGGDFSHANVRGANFSHASLTGCDFSHADLTGAAFDGVQMNGCDIDAGTLSPSQAGAVLRACKSGCDMSGANLQNQDLRNIRLVGVDLGKADMRGSDLSGGVFKAVDFDHAQFAGTRAANATFVNCSFDGVDTSLLLNQRARIVNGDQ